MEHLEKLGRPEYLSHVQLSLLAYIFFFFVDKNSVRSISLVKLSHKSNHVSYRTEVLKRYFTYC